MEGTIPITHIRLLYDDDEPDPEDDQPSDLDDGKLYNVGIILSILYFIGPQPIHDGKIHLSYLKCIHILYYRHH